MKASPRSREREAEITRRFKRLTLGWLVFFTLTVGLGITILVAHDVSEREKDLYNQLLWGFLNETLHPTVFAEAQPPDEPTLKRMATQLAHVTEARRLKFKAPNGEIVWSDDGDLIGHTEQSTPEFIDALAGGVPAHYERVEDERAAGNSLLERWLRSWSYELYIPVSAGGDSVVGVVEIYQPPRIHASDIATELAVIWLILGAGFGAYLLLSHRLFLRTSEKIITLQAELEKEHRLAAVGAGVSKIVHDARNVLASVRFACARLASDDMTTSQRKELCEELNLPVSMSFRMLEDLLAFVSGKPVAFRGRDQKLLPLIEALLPILSPMLEAAGHRLALDVPTDLVLYCDEDKLGHILINLVRNGTEAMSTPGEIRIAAGAADDGVRMTVRDTGSGIEEELLPRIFEPFVSQTDKARPGLGLAIVGDLVAQHGGEITARNRPEGGAEFVLVFPNRPMAQRGQAAPE